MSKTHCKYCDITVEGVYANCPKCGMDLMHPYEPPTEPEPYQLAPTDSERELREQLSNLIVFRVGHDFANQYPSAYHALLHDAMQLIQSYAATQASQREQAAKLEVIDLLYWTYKELNDQSVHMKFVDAYNIIRDELTLTPPEESSHE